MRGWREAQEFCGEGRTFNRQGAQRRRFSISHLPFLIGHFVALIRVASWIAFGSALKTDPRNYTNEDKETENDH
jgi:hypothetical protein